MADHVQLTSDDVNERRIEALKELFPEAFTEAGIDWDRLRQALGEALDTGPERYSFSWAGRADAFRAMQAPSNATLVPCREESVDFEGTENIFIGGENLEVLKLLQKSYFGKVKMIYIDPPYNTGHDRIYEDHFRDSIGHYLRLTGQTDEEGATLTSNPETSGRFHSRWLTMMYPRLFLAHNLLHEDGMIFVSIGHEEVHNLRLLMNEVFGEESLDAQVVWQKVYSPRMDAKGYSDDADYILAYRGSGGRNVGRLSFQQNEKQFGRVDESSGKRYRRRSLRKEGKTARRSDRPNLFYAIAAPDGTPVLPIRPDGSEGCWRWGRERYEAAATQDLIEWVQTEAGWQVYVKQFLDESATRPPSTMWPHREVGHNHEAVEEVRDLFGRPVFENPKPTRLVRRMLELGTNPDDESIVIDFFAGSCTTAQAVLELNREDGGNRRFIMVQLPEPTEDPEFATIAEIGNERIRRVIARMKEEDAGKLEVEERDEDLGFKVFKLARSNYKVWGAIEADEEEGLEKALELLRQRLVLFENGLVEEARDEDVIYENLIREGYTLNAEIEALSVGEQHVHKVSEKERFFYICLDRQVDPEALQELEGTQDTVLVCLDAALDDSGKANLAEQFHLKTI